MKRKNAKSELNLLRKHNMKMVTKLQNQERLIRFYKTQLRYLGNKIDYILKHEYSKTVRGAK